MEVLIALLVALALAAALLASIAIWAPRVLALRALAVALAAAFVPLTYLGLNQLLGRPKPIDRAWLEPGDRHATVLGINMVEGSAIYLWLQIDGASEPQSYRLDWDLRLAERLQDLAEEAAELDGAIRIETPFAFGSLSNLGKLNMNVEISPPPPRKPRPPVVSVPDPRETQI